MLAWCAAPVLGVPALRYLSTDQANPQRPWSERGDSLNQKAAVARGRPRIISTAQMVRALEQSRSLREAAERLGVWHGAITMRREPSILAAREQMRTRRSGRKTSHVVLLDLSGSVVQRSSVPRGTTFLLSTRDDHYYDAANPTTFVRRTPDRIDFLSVECPTCQAFIGWACGSDHTYPIHRARIVEALKVKAVLLRMRRGGTNE